MRLLLARLLLCAWCVGFVGLPAADAIFIRADVPDQEYLDEAAKSMFDSTVILGYWDFESEEDEVEQFFGGSAVLVGPCTVVKADSECSPEDRQTISGLLISGHQTEELIYLVTGQPLPGFWPIAYAGPASTDFENRLTLPALGVPVVHPQHRPFPVRGVDLAYIPFQQPLTLDQFSDHPVNISPAVLADSLPEPNQQVIHVGYGATGTVQDPGTPESEWVYDLKKRAGHQLIDRVEPGEDDNWDPHFFLTGWDEVEEDQLPLESMVLPGDSGGGTYDENGFLIGINAFNSEGATFESEAGIQQIHGFEDWLMNQIDNSPRCATGDFNCDGEFSLTDLTMLARVADTIAAGDSQQVAIMSFDVSGDGTVDPVDLKNWVEEFAGTRPGDVNLDGRVDFSDFLELSKNFGKQGRWSSGDFDASGEVGFSDFLDLSKNFGFSSEQPAQSVPEPKGAGFALVTMWVFLHLRHSRAFNR